MDAHPFPSLSSAFSNPILGISETPSPFPTLFCIWAPADRVPVWAWRTAPGIPSQDGEGRRGLVCFANGGSDKILQIRLFGKLNSDWHLRGSALPE